MLKFEEEDTNFDGLKNLNDESFFASVILSFCHFVILSCPMMLNGVITMWPIIGTLLR